MIKQLKEFFNIYCILFAVIMVGCTQNDSVGKIEKVKNEIWQTIQEMNHCWTSGDPSNLKNYFHENMVAISPADSLRLDGREDCVAAWTSFSKDANIHYWKVFDKKIQVYGNVAIVTYYYDMSFDIGDQTINTAGRDMLTLVNENGKWWIVADQFSPYPKQ